MGYCMLINAIHSPQAETFGRELSSNITVTTVLSFFSLFHLGLL
jgi:hypothetical protein